MLRRPARGAIIGARPDPPNTLMDSCTPLSVHCTVFRCSRQPEMYVYIRSGLPTTELPEALRLRAGHLTEVMQLELHAERRLARVDVRQVMAALTGRGYFLQMPPEGAINGNLDDGD